MQINTFINMFKNESFNKYLGLVNYSIQEKKT